MFANALDFHKKGQLARAKQLYEQILELQPAHFDALLSLGLLACQTGEFGNAVLSLAEALKINPQHAAAHFILGNALKELCKNSAAVECYDNAIRCGHVGADYNLGLALGALNQHAAAIDSYDKAIARRPDHPDAHYNRGNAQNSLKQYEAALHSFDRAIAQRGNFAAAYCNRGIALKELNRLEAAVDSYGHAIALKADLAAAYGNRGNAFLAMKEFDLAVSSYDQGLALEPGYPDGNFNRGNALFLLERYEQAVHSYDKAIALASGSAEAYYNRGNALLELGRYQSAVDSYDNAIVLDENYAKANYGRGNALYALDHFYAAIDSYDKAITLRSDYAQAACNRGNALRDTSQYAAALRSYDKSIALIGDAAADAASAHWNKSLLLLLVGDFSRGWREYEWRWKNGTLNIDRRSFDAPLWLGKESLAGKRILLHSEQGLGDTIQFCRYVRLVAALGAQVILEAPAVLLSILKNLEGLFKLIAAGEERPAFDFHCPLLSLPLVFATDLTNVPASVAYLAGDELTVQDWTAKLGPATKPRVGLVWSGNRQNPNDANRSIPLADLLRSLPSGAQYVSLQ
jgi:tetratricopeptide (TPR) repeat protein